MPELADPMQSVGYLIAAGAITLVTLAGYVAATVRRLAETRARNAELRRATDPTAVGGRR
ncbi:MAG: hypothetical protein QOF51_2636 [Chloroflexota bacterium]|jgi:hypothetical protein|nr:hypothetical protein [Chloroflexota bacterium]